MTGLSSRPDPDPKLIQKAQKGDRESLEALLKEVGPPVRQWALAHTGDPEQAADLTQEVFVILLRKLPSYRGDSRFLTWLFTVTRNQAMEGVRRKGRHEKKMARLKVETGGKASTDPNPASELDRGRIGRVVAAFVHELPRRQREVFQMSEIQGFTSPEIGKILDLDPASVRAALFKARRALRQRILENHPELVEEYLA